MLGSRVSQGSGGCCDILSGDSQRSRSLFIALCRFWWSTSTVPPTPHLLWGLSLYAGTLDSVPLQQLVLDTSLTGPQAGS